MNLRPLALAALAILMVSGLSACSYFTWMVPDLGTDQVAPHGEGAGQSMSVSQRPTDSEESATQYAPSDTYDQVRAGAQLSLSYDPTTQSFTGTVTNVTDTTLGAVRVEVHLSNGTELGPTTPRDLAPGQSVDVTLVATGQQFDSWGAHPEVGGGGDQGAEAGSAQPESPGEHQGGGGESGGESGGEHGSGESGESAGQEGGSG